MNVTTCKIADGRWLGRGKSSAADEGACGAEQSGWMVAFLPFMVCSSAVVGDSPLDQKLCVPAFQRVCRIELVIRGMSIARIISMWKELMRFVTLFSNGGVCAPIRVRCNPFDPNTYSVHTGCHVNLVSRSKRRAHSSSTQIHVAVYSCMIYRPGVPARFISATPSARLS